MPTHARTCPSLIETKRATRPERDWARHDCRSPRPLKVIHFALAEGALVQSNFRRSNPAALRSAERRQREDEAPRLKAAAPSLATLQISICEEHAGGSSKHIKHVVVERAPALFVIPCGDANCIDGGHDLTQEVMSALRSQTMATAGDSTCSGMTGSAPCSRRIHFDLTATYEP